MVEHLRPFSDFIIFQLKCAKLIKSENGHKWSAPVINVPPRSFGKNNKRSPEISVALEKT